MSIDPFNSSRPSSPVPIQESSDASGPEKESPSRKKTKTVFYNATNSSSSSSPANPLYNSKKRATESPNTTSSSFSSSKQESQDCQEAESSSPFDLSDEQPSKKARAYTTSSSRSLVYQAFEPKFYSKKLTADRFIKTLNPFANGPHLYKGIKSEAEKEYARHLGSGILGEGIGDPDLQPVFGKPIIQRDSSFVPTLAERGKYVKRAERILDCPGFVDDYYSHPLAVSESGYLIGIILENKVYFWNAVTGDILSLPENFISTLKTIFFDPLGKAIFIGFEDGRLDKWDISDLRNPQRIYSTQLFFAGTKYESGIRALAVCVSPEAKKRILGLTAFKERQQEKLERLITRRDASVYLFSRTKDLEHKKQMEAIKADCGAIMERVKKTDSKIKDLSEKNAHLFVGNKQGELFEVNHSDGTIVAIDNNPQIFNDHNDFIISMAVSPDGKYLLSTSGDMKIIVRKLSDKSIVGTIERENTCVRAVAFHPTKTNVVAIGGGVREPKITFHDVTNRPNHPFAAIDYKSQVTNLIWEKGRLLSSHGDGSADGMSRVEITPISLMQDENGRYSVPRGKPLTLQKSPERILSLCKLKNYAVTANVNMLSFYHLPSIEEKPRISAPSSLSTLSSDPVIR